MDLIEAKLIEIVTYKSQMPGEDRAGTYLIGYFDEGHFRVIETFDDIRMARVAHKHYAEAPGPDLGVQVARIIEEGR